MQHGEERESKGTAWPSYFRKRRRLNLNVPLALVAHPFNVEDDLVYSFMAMGEVGKRNDIRAEQVQQKCAQRELQYLDVRTRRGSEVALLDERAPNGRRIHPQASLTPLTAQMLEERLQPQGGRYQPSGEPIPQDNSTATTGRHEQTATLQRNSSPAVERRIIFVSDLDRRSLLALARTASTYNYVALQKAVYQYFASALNYIGAEIPSGAVRGFEFTFHLPFFAWRESTHGTHWHEVFDATFLDWETKTPAYIFPAKYSFAVTGIDEWRWTAYCFVDTLFDTDDDAECVSNYVGNSQGPGGMHLDPCTAGEEFMDNVVQDPRKYFLRVLAARLACISEEWRRIAHKVEGSVDLYVQASLPTPARCRWVQI